MSDEITKIAVNDKEVLDLLNRLMHLLEDTEPLMAEIADQMGRAVQQQFIDEEGPDGQAWPTLAESTKARREKRGYMPIKMLRASGILASSVQAKHGNDYAQVGSNSDYARIHFFGGEAGRGHAVTIPARPYLPVSADGELNETLKEDILEIMQNYLNSAGV